MNNIESIPQVWDDERDGQFFRLTQSLFDTTYCYGAGVLLASYDTDEELATAAESATYQPEPVQSTDSTSASSSR